MLSVAEATARILSAFDRLGTEQVGLENALGRVLAMPVSARLTQPAKAVSAMDGYAVRSADMAGAEIRLRLIAEVAAGHAPERPVGAGETARIFTGAMLPDGADSIVIQENSTKDGDVVILADPRFRSGQHVRAAGLDFSAGDIGLQPGRCLTARDIGLAAAMNWPWLTVTRRPRVAVLSTGDELVNPGEALSPGKIMASNGFTVAALAAVSGANVLNLGNAPDQPERLSAMIDSAKGCDLLVTIGGASVGDYDLVQKILKEKGVELDFWKIAMRPGKPVMFGRLGDLNVIGLPGNPTSALVTSVLFVRPAIARMLGRSDEAVSEYATLGRDLPANDQRQDYLRASLTRDAEHRLIATPFKLQDSSMIRLLAEADALVVRPPHAPAAAAGSRVEIIRLGGGVLNL